MRRRGDGKKSFTRGADRISSILAMSENPHVRAIHIFSPKDELRIDDGDPRRRVSTKRSANPVAGLLDEADAETKGKPSTSRPAERGTAEAAGSRAPGAGTSPGAARAEQGPPVDSSVESAVASPNEPLLGDMPEIIQGDFPDPVDL